MTIATQFCIGMERKTGTLAALCGVLHEADVNIEALFVSDDDEGCWVNMVAVPADAADRALEAAGYHFFAEKVLTMTATSKPGELARIAARFSDAGVDVEYVYGSGQKDAPFTLVLSAQDIEKAAKLIQG